MQRESGESPWLRCRRGRGPLWRIFWLYGVLGSMLLAATLLLGYAEQPGPSRALVGVILFSAYTAWAVRAIWSCAFNVEDREWGYVARAVVLFWALNLILGFGFLLFDMLVCSGCG